MKTSTIVVEQIIWIPNDAQISWEFWKKLTYIFYLYNLGVKSFFLSFSIPRFGQIFHNTQNIKERFFEIQLYFTNTKGKTINSHAFLFKRLNNILQKYEQWPQHLLNDRDIGEKYSSLV